LQERVEVSDVPRVNPVLLKEQVRPEGDTDSIRVNAPAKPFSLVTVIMDVPVAPASRVRLAGRALIAKSFSTTKRTVIVWDNAPAGRMLVALTVAEKLPIVDAVQNKVELAAGLRRILVSERRQTRPAEEVNDRIRGPVNLPVAALAVIVELPSIPPMRFTLEGFAERVKSCTVSVTLTA
jgi:hypothetical protein